MMIIIPISDPWCIALLSWKWFKNSSVSLPGPKLLPATVCYNGCRVEVRVQLRHIRLHRIWAARVGTSQGLVWKSHQFVIFPDPFKHSTDSNTSQRNLLGLKHQNVKIPNFNSLFFGSPASHEKVPRALGASSSFSLRFSSHARPSTGPTKVLLGFSGITSNSTLGEGSSWRVTFLERSVGETVGKKRERVIRVIVHFCLKTNQLCFSVT